MEWFIAFIVALFAASAIYGWFSDKSKKLREDEYNRNLRQQLHDQKQQFEREMGELTRQFEKRAEFAEGLRKEFTASYVRGRKWLAAFIAEGDRAVDDSISANLKYKKRPAYKASEEVSAAPERVNDFETPGCINLVSKDCCFSRGRSPVLVG